MLKLFDDTTLTMYLSYLLTTSDWSAANVSEVTTTEIFNN